jgi:hypothetical protein
MKRLDKIIPEAIAQACQKHGVIQHRVVSEWGEIVGRQLAEVCSPMHVKFLKNKEVNGVLVIGVINPGYILELQSIRHTILQRLTAYFGYNAINKLQIVYTT